MSRARESLARVALPLLFAVAALLLWELYVRARDVPTFVLPSPSAIFEALRANFSAVVSAGRASGVNAVVGLVAGSVVAVLAAVLAARSRALREGLLPLSAAANAMPIVALAPLFNTMLGSTSEIPRRLVVTIVVFFPVFVNTVRGLSQVQPVHAELMRSYAVSGWAFTRTVRLPGALPHLFTGLRLASALAVIAAVVAEYFGGLQTGLGSRITSAASNSAYPRAWAYVTAACVLGLAFYAGALLLERLATPWRSRPQR